ncbi:glutathione S-transferase family protein [Aspergillus mulundensis]|uniref:Glutathione S-transferase n=1 Tax=Aspergillus mulundensis TaxID=1810919 RepID=A0A3D8R3Y1_9EURO|nr:Uncharacterized protein DSM5745_08479 [Aspergillus mulundensis]RDW68719.1 Uncharacterized protein DSM5745_08479 [Aspergillus mulundensis]
MPDIKLFFTPGACSLAPHILLHETNLDFTPLLIKPNGLEVDFPSDYKALNPKMRVPVIVVDGEVVTEVPAICTLISQLSPNNKIMGATPLETVRIYEWLNYLSGTVHAAGFGLLFRPWRWTVSGDEEVHVGIKEKARENIRAAFELIEGRLTEESTFALGDELTAVDAFLYPLYRWAVVSAFDLVPYPKLGSLIRRLEGRESVRIVLEKEGLERVTEL